MVQTDVSALRTTAASILAPPGDATAVAWQSYPRNPP